MQVQIQRTGHRGKLVRLSVIRELSAARYCRWVPLLGHVQAGALTEAVEEAEGYLPVDGRPSAEELFALQIQGESMRDAGMLPGDVVIVRAQSRVDSGAIAVALVGTEATVKTFYRRDGQVELHPANPSFDVIVLDPDEVEIIGEVVEVRRYLDGLPLLDSVPL